MRRIAVILALLLVLSACSMPSPREELIPTPTLSPSPASASPSSISAMPTATPAVLPTPSSLLPASAAIPPPARTYGRFFQSLLDFKAALPSPLVAPAYLPARLDPAQHSDLFYTYSIDYLDTGLTQLYGYTMSLSVAMPSYGDTQSIQSIKITAMPASIAYAVPETAHDLSKQVLANAQEVSIWSNWTGEGAPPDGELRMVTAVMDSEERTFRYVVQLSTTSGDAAHLQDDLLKVLHSMIARAYDEAGSLDELVGLLDFKALLPRSLPPLVDPTEHHDVLTSHLVTYGTEDRIGQHSATIIAKIADGSRSSASYRSFSYTCFSYQLNMEGFPGTKETHKFGDEKITLYLYASGPDVSCVFEHGGLHYRLSITSADNAPSQAKLGEMERDLRATVLAMLDQP